LIISPLSLTPLPFSSQCSRHPPDLPSFPTRRSSDLRQEALARLRATVESGRPIIGGGAGTGLSAKAAEAGGIDLIIIYNSGRYQDRKSTRLNSSHVKISYAVFCLKKKNKSHHDVTVQ